MISESKSLDLLISCSTAGNVGASLWARTVSNTFPEVSEFASVWEGHIVPLKKDVFVLVFCQQLIDESIQCSKTDKRARPHAQVINIKCSKRAHHSGLIKLMSELSKRWRRPLSY